MVGVIVAVWMGVCVCVRVCVRVCKWECTRMHAYVRTGMRMVYFSPRIIWLTVTLLWYSISMECLYLLQTALAKVCIDYYYLSIAYYFALWKREGFDCNSFIIFHFISFHKDKYFYFEIRQGHFEIIFIKNEVNAFIMKTTTITIKYKSKTASSSLIFLLYPTRYGIWKKILSLLLLFIIFFSGY